MIAHELTHVVQQNGGAVQRSHIKSTQLQQQNPIQRMIGDDVLEDQPQTSQAQTSQAQTSQEFLSEVLGVDIDKNKEKMIPQEIHRFWSGGKMSQQAMKVLIESAEKTKDTAWQNNMWYSSTLEKTMDSSQLVGEDEREMRNLQREVLKELGYKVRQIEDIAEDDPKPLGTFDKLRGKKEPERTRGRMTKGDLGIMAGKAASKLEKGGQDRWDGVKHISDIARLMYLDQVGGHHLDVDMGLGEMDLTRAYSHNDPKGNIPLLGAVTATESDPIAESLARLQHRNDNGGLSNPETREAGTRVAEQARDMTGMLNGMIASRPGNDNIKEAIEQLRVDAVSRNGEIPSGMLANNALLFGEQGNQGIDHEEQGRMRSLAVPPYLFDLEHLTSESENR